MAPDPQSPPTSTAPPDPAPTRAGGPGRALALLRLLVPAVALGLVAVVLHRVEPPGPGPFYDPPDPLPAGPPGALLRLEPVARPPAGAAAWRVLYTSRDRGDRPIAVSGTVFAPAGDPPPAGRPVVAWAHPTAGVARRCAPSLGDAAAIPGLAAMLAAGWVVTATDYPGLGTPGPHPYLVGESEGRAVLDSIRAARALPGAGVGPATPAAVWGHSQGGHAALFAGQLAPAYAPDQRLAAVAAAAPATDLRALLEHDLGGTAGNVLASLALVSWSQVYRDDGLTLDQVVERRAQPVAHRIAERCTGGGGPGPLAVDLPAAEILRLRVTAPQPWNVEGWDEQLAANSPGATPVPVPVLVSQGTADTVVWHAMTADWARDHCTPATPVHRRDYDGAGHLDIATRSAPDTVDWIAQRFAGRPVEACAG